MVALGCFLNVSPVFRFEFEFADLRRGWGHGWAARDPSSHLPNVVFLPRNARSG